MATTQVREFVKIPDAVRQGLDAVIERAQKIDAEGERIIRSAIDLGKEQIERLERFELPAFNGRGRRLVSRLGDRYEDGLSRVFGLFNLPTRRDLEEVNRRVDKLQKRVASIGKPAPAAKKKVVKEEA